MYRIGILNATRVSRTGGGFHYIMTLIEALRTNSDLEVVVFYDDPDFRDFCFDSPRFRWIMIEERDPRMIKLIRGASTLMALRSPLLGRFKPLSDYKIDLLISFDSLIGFHLGIPFLGFMGDVMYKYYPALPEYSWRHRWTRDMTTKMLIMHAEFTVVDSEESKKDLTKFFGAAPEKLRPIPLCAPPHIYQYRDCAGSSGEELMAKYQLPPRFVFYPAQFWSHKNHANLVRALDLVRRRHGVEIPAVFVGSARESYGTFQSLLKDLDMVHQVRCLGYLPEEEIVALYKKADALVFASFADYTSIPLVEAMVLGTPIVCSNVFSLPEQVGDAGLLFDPFNLEEMAEAVYRIWTEEDLRRMLIANGRKRAEELSLENFAGRWRGLIQEALERSRG